MGDELGIVYLPASNGLPGTEERHLERLRRRTPSLDWRWCHDKDEAEALLPDAVAMLTWAFSSKWQEKAPRLRLISTPAAGREMVRASPRDGLKVWHGSFHGELMAETVVGLMLAFTRGIRDCLGRRGEVWPRVEVMREMRPLRSSHAVILGFGHIGKWIGRLLKSFGVRLSGVNRSNLDRPVFFDAGDQMLTTAELDGVLPFADHLILVLPGGEATSGIIGAERLALLRPTAYVYNVGRGNAIDMPALEEALLAGRLAGAGLDVFPEEPLPADARIRGCPNAILMPHVSAFAPNYLDLYLDELLPGLEGMFPGKKE